MDIIYYKYMNFMDIPSIIDSLGHNKDVTFLIATVLIHSVKQIKNILCNKNFLQTVKTFKNKDSE